MSDLNHVYVATINPNITPLSVGVHWINTTSNSHWISVATTSVSDWQLQTNGISVHANIAALPVSGAVGIIYVVIDTNKIYRWDGSSYVELSPSGSSGEVAEIVAGICDGRTVIAKSGSYILQDGTPYFTTTTYADIAGSSIAYTPPTGTKTVIYEFIFHVSTVAGISLNHFRFMIDGVEVTLTKMQCGGGAYTNEFKNYTVVIEIGTNDVANGKVLTWTTPKTLKVQGRVYAATYQVTCNQASIIDGAVAPIAVKPQLKITSVY
jgi:hypothetical protein